MSSNHAFAGLCIAACTALLSCAVTEPPQPQPQPAPQTPPQSPPQSPPEQPQSAARQQFEDEVFPLLEARCAACHSSQGPLGFMESGTPQGVYDALFAYEPPLLNLESPASSLLITVGDHGVGLVVPNLEALLAWIEAERDERDEP